MEAISDSVHRVLPYGRILLELVRWDLERISKFEMFGPDASADLAEGSSLA